MKIPRQYQQDALEAIWNNLDIHPLVSVPTGGGKSLIIAELCKRAIEMYKGTRIAIIVPKKELVTQNYQELIEQYPKAPVGIFCAGLNQKNAKDITIATIQSIYKHDNLKPYDLIIVDESHLISKNNDGMFHDFFSYHENAKIIGLTATPYRMKSGYLHKGEGALFDKLVYECDIRSLVKDKYLSPIVSYSGSKQADLTNVHIRAGEFKADEMQAEFISNDITEAAVKDCIKKCKLQKSIIVFASGIEHSMQIIELFRDANIGRIEGVTSETKKHERDSFVQDFKDQKIRILVNVNVYTTGFNAPNVDTIILLRATKSPGLYVQMVGRGLRIAPKK